MICLYGHLLHSKVGLRWGFKDRFLGKYLLSIFLGICTRYSGTGDSAVNKRLKTVPSSCLHSRGKIDRMRIVTMIFIKIADNS